MGSSGSSEGGFRVFKVNPGSPAAEGGLEVFFDFILEVDGHKMDADQRTFFNTVTACENKKTKLVVYNIRTNTVRDVVVMPRQWGGVGLLGSTVRYDTFDNTENQGIRVLEVFPNSPAAHAGLTPFKDYLLGTSDVMFRDLDELVELVTANIDKRMEIYVYNADTETTREATICPNMNWGGEGSIGCDIGTGLLHRIPVPRRPVGGVTPQAPPEHSNGTRVPAAPPMAPGAPGAPLQAAWPPGMAPPIGGSPPVVAGVAAAPPPMPAADTGAAALPTAPLPAAAPPYAAPPTAVAAPSLEQQQALQQAQLLQQQQLIQQQQQQMLLQQQQQQQQLLLQQQQQQQQTDPSGAGVAKPPDAAQAAPAESIPAAATASADTAVAAVPPAAASIPLAPLQPGEPGLIYQTQPTSAAVI